MKAHVYADNAATTQLDSDAFEAMKPYLLNEFGNPSQPYSFSRPAKKALSEARATIAAAIGAQESEIFFTSGGTESDNWAIKGVAFADSFKRTTITSTIEHHAVLHSCKALEQLDYPVVYIESDKNGLVSPELLKGMLTDNTSLVSIMLANNEVGTIEPIEKLCAIAHEHGVSFHTDAVQAVGHIPVDVNTLGVDLLSASAHKFNGPKGVGFLYIRTGTKIAPYHDGGAQQQNMRAGTENVAGIIGMAVALKKNCSELERHKTMMAKLERIVISRLTAAGLDFIQNGGENHLPGNISLSFAGADGEMLLHRLDLMGICISTGSACDNVNAQVSHVIKAINVPERYAKGTIRLSFGRDNTEDEAQKIADGIIHILKP